MMMMMRIWSRRNKSFTTMIIGMERGEDEKEQKRRFGSGKITGNFKFGKG